MNQKTLREEIAEILVDAYGEEEQATSWEVAFQDQVAVPFRATLLNASVTVIAFRSNERNVMQCHAVGGDKKRWISIEDLDGENLPDDFRHLLGLYEAWSTGRY